MTSTDAKALTVYDSISNPIESMKTLGYSIAHSKMFGCETEQQGEIMALECMARRCPPMQLAQRFHLIKGKLSMKTEAMLSDFVERCGGKCAIVERSADRSAIVLTVDGETEQFSLSWDQAKEEPFVYEGKESVVVELLATGSDKLKLKPKYATPRSRMQMLWARVVSDGIRCMKPQVTSGIYTPEEVSDFDDVNVDLPASTIEPVTNQANDALADPLLDAEQVPFNVPPAEVVEMIDGTRIIEINTLFAQLEISEDQQAAALAKRDAVGIQHLTLDAAEDLLAILRCAKSKQTTKSVMTPCTQAEIEEIVSCAGAVAQNGIANIGDQIAAKLKSAGKDKLAQLTSEDAQALIESLKTQQMESFFARSLEDFSPQK